MCLNHDLCVFWVSSLAYPNSLGTKGYVVVVIVVMGSQTSALASLSGMEFTRTSSSSCLLMTAGLVGF